MKKPIQFGKYYLLERLNVGGMAEVFKAKTLGVEGFERMLAVKRILPNIAEDREFIAMFIDEAKIAVQLSHANIAQVFDLGKVDDSYFIALEYVAGKDLRALFDRGRRRGDGRAARSVAGEAAAMPIAQACFTTMKICEGLDYAHNKRDAAGRELHLVHRDVSPQNVLVSWEGEVKLIDFGIATAAGKATKTQAGILKGKFGYMSPEQVRGLPCDRRSDVFSAGIVFYELLTGERLFVGETDFSTLEKVRNVIIRPPRAYNAGIPEDLERIVLRALAKDVEDRYQSAIDLHDELQAFLYTSGQACSRKELAAWMKHHFAGELAEERRRDEAWRNVDLAAVAVPARRAALEIGSAWERTDRARVERTEAPPAAAGGAAQEAWDDEEDETGVYEAGAPLADEDLLELEPDPELDPELDARGLESRGPDEPDTEVRRLVDLERPEAAPAAPRARRSEAVAEAVAGEAARSGRNGSARSGGLELARRSALVAPTLRPVRAAVPPPPGVAPAGTARQEIGSARAPSAPLSAVGAGQSAAVDPLAATPPLAPPAAARALPGNAAPIAVLPGSPSATVIVPASAARTMVRPPGPASAEGAPALPASAMRTAIASRPRRSTRRGAARLYGAAGATFIAGGVLAGVLTIKPAWLELHAASRRTAVLAGSSGPPVVAGSERVGSPAVPLAAFVEKPAPLRSASSTGGATAATDPAAPPSSPGTTAPAPRPGSPPHPAAEGTRLRARAAAPPLVNRTAAASSSGPAHGAAVAQAEPSARPAPSSPSSRAPRRPSAEPADDAAPHVLPPTPVAAAGSVEPRGPRAGVRSTPAAASAEGFLRLNSKPWTNIAVDGKDSGLRTPQTHLRLNPGVHRVALSNPQFGISETFSVEIHAGGTETVIKDLRPRNGEE